MKDIEMMKHEGSRKGLPDIFCKENYEKVKRFHESMEGYSYSPLVKADSIARKAGVGKVYVKDESKRYGLNAFKALGAAYAMGNMDVKEGDLFVTATDGNHGRAVAWAAEKMECKAVVFMPRGTVEARSKVIADIPGTTVYVTDLNYDDAVRRADEYAREHGGYLVQDTAFEGYTDIPWDISLGYTRLMAEALEQLGGEIPTHVFLQAGVGSMSGGVTGYLADVLGDKCPVISVMEAKEAACIFESVKEGRYVTIGGHPRTIMAGLNCGEANILTLDVLKEYASFFFKVGDEVTIDGMRAMHEEGIVAGECGGIGPGLLLDMDRSMKEEMGLDESSVVLFVSTEGDTDPAYYKKIISSV